MKGIRWGIGAIAVLAAALAASSAMAGVSGTTHKVSGVLDFQGVACPPKGSCLAVGETPRSKQNYSSGVFAEISNGKPGSAKPVAGTNLLNRVTCPSDNFCIAVGFAFSGSTQKAIFVTIKNGKAGAVHDLGMNSAASIGCGSATSCWIPGDDYSYSQNGAKITPMLVHLSNAKVQKTYTLSGSYSFAAGESGGATPFCYTATSCVLVGTSGFQNGTGLIFSIDNGKVKILHKVTGTSGLSGLFCSSKSSCRILGYKDTSSSETGDVFTLGSRGVGKLYPINLAVFPLACVSMKTCFAFGAVFKSGKATEYIVPIDSGKPGTRQKIDTFVSAGTCRGTGCLGVGEVGSFPSEQGTVFSFKG